MPAYATHYVFSKELEGEVEKLFPQLDRAALIYGTQGPDFLLFHRILPTMPGKSLRVLCTRLHHADSAVLFAAMQEYVLQNPQDVYAVSYAIGFLLHFALDSAAHPYVYCTQERYIKKRRVHYWGFVVHNRIEFNIDSEMLRRRAGFDDARKFMAADVLDPDEKRLFSIGRLMSFATEKTLGEKLSAEDFVTALRDMKKLVQTLSNPKGKKSILFALLQLPTYLFLGPVFSTMSRPKKADGYWDYMNDSGADWLYPADRGIVKSDSFISLFEAAQKKAVLMTAEFLSGGDMSKATEHLSFTTGLPVSGERL